MSCISCKKPFTTDNVFTHAGWKETQISQMCEKCFDECTLQAEVFEDSEEITIKELYKKHFNNIDNEPMSLEVKQALLFILQRLEKIEDDLL